MGLHFPTLEEGIIREMVRESEFDHISKFV